VTQPAPASPTSLRAAHVRRVHGVKGEVRAEMLGGDARRFRSGLRLRVERSGAQLVVRSSRDGGDGTVLLAFQGVNTVVDAAALRGAYLCVSGDEARELGSGEWFVWQLIGLRAVTPDGDELGTVRDVEPARAADVVVIESAAGERRFPMVREFVRHVDIPAGTITLAPVPEDAA